ncbi:helix-hairpin-helix domain-containing protein [Micromonospora olivasterospora]|uniref:Putative flap endonuclease-1-like 5' DNA nuclease n=1 Tax=Micromonospora olivasterospora TaxID=1880 RepID=A0A562IH14_MICOL|nr:helix-hairpin-helix domain-containing protein [Micromonospora olivasterospora]TWH70043.1 putative flap endonuclease-1-like 5' DNA nuclease [Micromonospora olivasterospora]
MPSTFGQWLFAILALLVGLAAGWLLRGRQGAPGARPSTAEGDPVAGVAGPPAEATVDLQRPAATVVPVTAQEAVVDEPAPDTAEPTRPGAVLADSDPTAFAAEDDTPARQGTEVPAADPAAEPSGDDQKTEPVVPAPRAAADDADLPETGDPATAEAAPTLPSGGAATQQEAAGTDAPPVAAETDAGVATPAPAAEAGAGAAQAAGAAGPADDFRRIQGVGPKMAAALHDAGIRTYQQLADLDEAALRETIRAAGLRAAPSLATWPQQARVLAGAPAEADRVLPATVGANGNA